MALSDDYKIYVDASRPATLNNGAGVLTDCATLQEAVLAWQRLAPEQKICFPSASYPRNDETTRRWRRPWRKSRSTWRYSRNI